MDLGYLRLLLDFGLVVLIWLVQLIIYPSFTYLERPKLLSWHGKYSLRISLVVIPLMLGQLFITIFQLMNGSLIIYLIAILVLAVWLITFLYFVPAHGKISRNEIDDRILDRLVTVNWWRTLIWSAIFILALVELIF